MKHQTHIAIYARVSSDQQAQHGTIESQLAAVQKFAAENGLKVDPDLIFADNGVSGSTLARPKLDALRDRAAAGEIDQVLVLAPDRLARILSEACAFKPARPPARRMDYDPRPGRYQ